MKNQYVGDINDFFKYSILEIIEKELGKKIFVAWMLTKSEGMDIEYSEYKNLNESLYSNLQEILISNKRNVESIQSIYTNYLYHSELLEKRKREEYFNEVEIKSQTSDLIFFDPDNGISYTSDSIEHLNWDEIKRFWNDGKGKDLLIYQHFRRQKWNEFISELNEHIKKDLKGALLVPIKTKNVMFLYIGRKDIKKKLEKPLARWGELITIFDGDNNGNI